MLKVLINFEIVNKKALMRLKKHIFSILFNNIVKYVKNYSNNFRARYLNPITLKKYKGEI